MPIYKHQQVNSIAKLWVWHITEDEQSLTKNVSLTTHCNQRLQAMSHSNQRKGFLAVRSLVEAAGLSLDQLRYTTYGKPYIEHGPHISFSHTRDFAWCASGAILKPCRKRQIRRWVYCDDDLGCGLGLVASTILTTT